MPSPISIQTKAKLRIALAMAIPPAISLGIQLEYLELAFIISSIGILCIELYARFFSGARSLAALLYGASWTLACNIVMMPVGLAIRAIVEGMSWFGVFVFSAYVPVILPALVICGLVMILTHDRAHPKAHPTPVDKE
ncbi:MAG: hypothetical protein JST35_00475 [Armatimonadetes bacterium]|nr:hypothetical protein [Armatimonadota bacterium]